jgi:thiosulfate/3-mercaptopyruvate sulfurtransferase
MHYSTLMIAIGLCSLAVAGTSAPESQPYPNSKLLIEPAELARAKPAFPGFVILDVRERAKYEAASIPHALCVEPAAWAKAFKDSPEAAAWSKRIGGLGIVPNSTVVLFDDSDNKDAARIWWILRYWGIDDARLLDGGWSAWKAAGLPTASGGAKAPAATSITLTPRAERLATKEQVRQSLEGRTQQVVDARSQGEFCGTEKNAKRSGAIPGAKHLEWSDLIDPKTHRFKEPAELRRLFHEANIDLARPTTTYCQSGGRASVMAFGLELMGAKDVRNYYASWAEWGNADDTPVEPGKPKP